ncbi:MAG: O-antigen ligase family protein [Prevotella sp.]|nr:O-antigen ligase family protein [Prevotella sp.]
MTGFVRSYTHEHGGRVATLFLLFLLAIYIFITSGFTGFAFVCATPLIILFAYIAFKQSYIIFWTLLIVNYNVQFFSFNEWLPNGIPLSAYNELIEITLIAIAIIDIRKDHHWGRAINMMSFAILLWVLLCALEIFNDTCRLGINVNAWFIGFRLIAFQLVYIILVFSIYIDSPEILTNYLKIWAILSLFSVYWTIKQKYIGLNSFENARIHAYGSTHFVNGIVRYWSTFSDAANYGCNAAATSVCFLLIGLTSKFTKERIFYIITGLLVLWGMFQSGTRVALACFFAGLMVYVVLSKSVKFAAPIIIFGVVAFVFLAFTNIGQGNNQIRRMRSAFNKNDASANVRTINQATMAKYLKEAPWGIGIGIRSGEVPARNKYVVLSNIAPDSEYVYIWIHTGRIGLTVFLVSMFLMLAGACWIVLFKLRNKSLAGIGAGFCCAFAAMQLGAYGNQVLYQYPNGLIFFGGLAIVYVLPYLEKDWETYEQTKLAKQEEKKRLKLEKKLASRV